jgi:RNA polymerase sigma factor (sigma-70 family)
MGTRAEELMGNFAYMSKVSSNLAIRAWRASGRDAGMDAGFDDTDRLEGKDDPALPVLREEAVSAIASSLVALRDIERAVIRQRYWDELSFAEIARRSGLPLNSVLSLHRRALAKLRPLVASYFEADGDGPFSRPKREEGRYSRFFP